MEDLGAMAYSRYTGFREITDRDVLELHCTEVPLYIVVCMCNCLKLRIKINFIVLKLLNFPYLVL